MNKNLLEYYYKDLPVIPVENRGKDPVHKFSNFRRYKISDIKKNNNIAILTGTEISRDKFTAILDCDIDVDTQEGIKIFEIIKRNCADTVIVKSGGKHNGFHVYFTTDVPVKSALIPFNYGFIELKGIRENGYAEQMMMPPSVNIGQYRVIYPEKSLYVDFRKVRHLNTDELKNRLENIIYEVKINNL